jgi:hypothetical protein
VKHEKAYRGVFLAAGAYNILWGSYAVADPQWFFRLTGLPLSNTPQIFATLGMVLGLYGILYLDVARRPAHGRLVAAVALAGKVLGPLGLAWLILTGAWPPGTIILAATNDLIWWIPFACYLRDAARAEFGEHGLEAATIRGIEAHLHDVLDVREPAATEVVPCAELSLTRFDGHPPVVRGCRRGAPSATGWTGRGPGRSGQVPVVQPGREACAVPRQRPPSTQFGEALPQDAGGAHSRVSPLGPGSGAPHSGLPH